MRVEMPVENFPDVLNFGEFIETSGCMMSSQEAKESPAPDEQRGR